MKKYNKILSSLAIACLLTSTLNGCGNNTLKESETKAAQEETLQMEDSNEETLENADGAGEDVLVEIPNEVDGMRPILKGLCKVLTRGKTYDSSNANFYWEALYAAINGSTWIHPDIRLSDTGAGYLVPESALEEYAKAMFGDSTSIPELPSTVGGIEYDEEEEAYLFYSAGGLTGSMDIMAVDTTEDGYKVSVAFHTKKDAIENYTFNLSSGASGTFSCTVLGVVE